MSSGLGLACNVAPKGGAGSYWYELLRDRSDITETTSDVRSPRVRERRLGVLPATRIACRA